MPTVPNLAAAELCGAPSKTVAFQVIAKPSNPTDSMTAASSPSRRAPAIQPVQRSIFFLASSDTARSTRISAICSRPPGLSTRYISR